MKFVIATVFALWFGTVSAVPAVGGLNVKDLKFVLWGDHGEGTKTQVAAGNCPLGTLPDKVFMHKTFKHGDHYFTWVKPVHGLVNGVTCGTHDVWKGAAGELLLGLYMFGHGDANAKKFVHVFHLTPLGGFAHAFLLSDPAVDNGAVKPLGLAGFVTGVGALFKKEFLGLKGLPATALFHELALHWGLGLGGLPEDQAKAAE